MKNKTIRLVVPDWQAGNNPVYSLGANILATVAPESTTQPTVKVPLEKVGSSKENNVNNLQVIKINLLSTKQVIDHQKPNKIITLGGNCLVSQAPIDYLNGYYKGKMGVVWLDAHPDISNPEIFDNEHAMVVANLLKIGDPVFNKLVDNPLTNHQIFYAGLQTPTKEEQTRLQKAGIEYDGHQQLSLANVKRWAEQNQFERIYLHFDIDVLNPAIFYATYFNNPQLIDVPDNAPKGTAGLNEVFNFIKNVNQTFNLVGMTIAEYMPWSAQQLSSLMQDLSLFRN
jgi:arginase